MCAKQGVWRDGYWGEGRRNKYGTLPHCDLSAGELQDGVNPESTYQKDKAQVRQQLCF